MSELSVYDIATNNVINLLETAGSDWTKPWNVVGNRNATTGKSYRGVNSLMLLFNDFESNFWGTYKQWKSLDCQVNKGSTGTPIIFFNYIPKKEGGKPVLDDKGHQQFFPMVKQYSIFNFDQVEGDWTPPETKGLDNESISHIDQYFANTGADIRHGKDQAYYMPSQDYVGMPDLDQFVSTERYYNVLSHEVVHWTSAEKRCNRLNKKFEKRMGAETTYAFEELVAELGSIFMGIDFNIQTTPREENVVYLKVWLERLAQDKKLIFSASSYAQKAVNFSDDLQKKNKMEKVA